jgi:putative modified peptide
MSTTTNGGAKQRTAPLEPKIADRLLDLLGTDDGFRDLFRDDPLAALRTIGYESPTPGKMTACGLMPAVELEPFAECKVQHLASKADILSAREEIKSMLTRGLAHTTPQLDAALTDERRTLK